MILDRQHREIQAVRQFFPYPITLHPNLSRLTMTDTPVQTIDLEFPVEYPLRPPLLTINGRSYLESLEDQRTHPWEHCPCCQSLLKGKWNPSITLLDLFQEIIFGRRRQ